MSDYVHDVKLMRKLRGRNVQITHGLAESLEPLEPEPEGFKERWRPSSTTANRPLKTTRREWLLPPQPNLIDHHELASRPTP